MNTYIANKIACIFSSRVKISKVHLGESLHENGGETLSAILFAIDIAHYEDGSDDEVHNDKLKEERNNKGLDFGRRMGQKVSVVLDPPEQTCLYLFVGKVVHQALETEDDEDHEDAGTDVLAQSLAFLEGS